MKIPQASGTQTNEAKVFTCAGGGAAFVESPRDYPLMEIPITSADHRAHLGGQCCTPYCVRDGLLPTTPDCCVESIPIISSLTCAFRTNQSTPYALFSTISPAASFNCRLRCHCKVSSIYFLEAKSMLLFHNSFTSRIYL